MAWWFPGGNIVINLEKIALQSERKVTRLPFQFFCSMFFYRLATPVHSGSSTSQMQAGVRKDTLTLMLWLELLLFADLCEGPLTSVTCSLVQPLSVVVLTTPTCSCVTLLLHSRARLWRLCEDQHHHLGGWLELPDCVLIYVSSVWQHHVMLFRQWLQNLLPCALCHMETRCNQPVDANVGDAVSCHDAHKLVLHWLSNQQSFSRFVSVLCSLPGLRAPAVRDN